MDESHFFTDLNVTNIFTYDLVQLTILLVGIVREVFIEIVLSDGIDDVVSLTSSGWLLGGCASCV